MPNEIYPILFTKTVTGIFCDPPVLHRAFFFPFNLVTYLNYSENLQSICSSTCVFHDNFAPFTQQAMAMLKAISVPHFFQSEPYSFLHRLMLCIKSSSCAWDLYVFCTLIKEVLYCNCCSLQPCGCVHSTFSQNEFWRQMHRLLYFVHPISECSMAICFI